MGNRTMNHDHRSKLGRRLALVVALGLAPLGGSAEAAPLKFEEIVVEGEVQKPEIAVFISRQNLNKQYELAPLRESFLPKIIEALSRPPF